MKQALTILGATGSIGVSTLDVVARHQDRYEVFALTAHRNIVRLAEQCRVHRPKVAVVATAHQVDELVTLLRQQGQTAYPDILWGKEGLVQVSVADDVHAVMAAIVGAAGLEPTLKAVESGKKVLLANKEALVMSGALMMETALRSGAQLLPVDSEHNAVFQCWPRVGAGVEKILLTASGGPFLHWSLEALSEVTPEQACRHPRWAMGRKISVDSATMMNKGLELIEACWLFDVPATQVEILIHPQSLVHSLVGYQDGSLLAQMGHTDMRIPIAHALAYPERHGSGVPLLDLASTEPLQFMKLDRLRFPAVRLAEEAMCSGGGAPIVLNAANEVAVAAFLDGRLRFDQITSVVERTLNEVIRGTCKDLESIAEVDQAARAQAGRQVGGYAP